MARQVAIKGTSGYAEMSHLSWEYNLDTQLFRHKRERKVERGQKHGDRSD